ncbi:MAG TPA: hypothetical protein VEY50_05620 [Lysobacter sp.]|nr:hypothetical protein [Lysobacter sp.]
MANPTTPSDSNRDPITGAPGAHPLGVGVGGVAGGALAGALAGTVFGPIGTLIGASAGVIAGAAAGKAVAERLDPTGEVEYWREAHRGRDYVKPERDFERDYRPAYEFGVNAREHHHDRDWSEVEQDLGRDWPHARASSQLDWDEARHPARDAWERADRTHRTYQASDRYFASRFEHSPYRSSEETFDDYRPAYRFGTFARSRYGERDWDDRLEAELRDGWERFRGGSRLTWERAKHAVREAFHTREDEYLDRGDNAFAPPARDSGMTTRSGVGPGTDRGF